MKKNIGIISCLLSILIFSGLIFKPALATDASLLPNAVQQFFSSSGAPLASGKVYFYEVGTSTFKSVYNSSAATTPYTNPITLNAGGKPPGSSGIYGIGLYRQLVKDSAGNTVWDAVTAPGGGGSTPTNVGDGNLVGTILPWSGLTAPNQYVFSYGQELVRATYPEFFTAVTLQSNVICTSASNILTGVADTSQIKLGSPVEISLCVVAGTTVVSKTTTTVVMSNPSSVSINGVATFFPYGNGNGSTTFNVPNLNGRVIAGRDNMGGTAANNLTTTYCATPGLGATCGSDSQTLTIAQLPVVTPAGTVSTPTITSSVSGGVLGGTATIDVTGGAGNLVVKTPTTITVSSSSSTPIFVGTPFGSGAAHPNVQPTMELNYVIKVTPDTSSSTATGVASLGGMTGVISCGSGLLCTGNIIDTAPLPVGTNTNKGIVQCDGTTINCSSGIITAVGSGGRTILSSPLTIYINPSASPANCNGITCGGGSDTTGNGTSTSPYATLLKGYNVVNIGYDLNGFTVTFQLADATYIGSFQKFGAPILGQIGPAGVVVQGNCSSPRSVLLQPSAGAGPAFLIAYGVSATIQCLEGDQTNQFAVFPSGGDIFSATHGSQLIVGPNMWFGCNYVGYNAISVAFSGAYLEIDNDFTVDPSRCQRNTTSTFSSSGTSMVVASATGLVRGMGFVPQTDVPADAFIASISGTTVTIGCIITSPCQFGGSHSGVATSFVGGGQFFIQAGFGAAINVASNGQSDYSIINTIQNYPFYQSGYYQGDLGVQSLLQGLTIVNAAQANGACFSNITLSSLDSGSYGIPYLPCLFGTSSGKTSATFVAGSNQITVSSATGIQVGQVVTPVIQTTGTWSAGGSTIAVASAAQIVVGSKVQGPGILNGAAARINNISGTTLTLDACGAGPKCVSGYPTYLAGSGVNLTFTNPVSYIPIGATVTAISGTTITLSVPAVGSGSTIGVWFQGVNTGGAQYQ